jgi:hypothetical protein
LPFKARIGKTNIFLFIRLKLSYAVSLFQLESLGTFETGSEKQTQEYQNNHYQYNLGMAYHLKHNWNITSGLSFFQQHISSFYGNYDYNQNQYEPSSTTTLQNSYAVSLGIGKQMRLIQPTVNVALSNFNNVKQLQGEMSLLYYPFGNSRFYSVSSLALINDGGENRTIVSEKLGGKITRWLWYETKVSIGNHQNYITQNGFLTYNTGDPIKIIAGADLKFYWKHLEIIPGYSLHVCEGKSIYYTNFDTYKTNNYTNHLIKTTLKWNF